MALKEPYIFTVEGNHLVAADAWTAERLDGFQKGTVVKTKTLVRPRSLPFQGFYWIHLSKIIKATECAPTPEHLHKALLKLCNYIKPIYNKHGKIIELVVDSTAFDAMSQDEFFAYVEEAKKALAHHLEIIWEDYDKTPQQGRAMTTRSGRE